MPLSPCACPGCAYEVTRGRAYSVLGDLFGSLVPRAQSSLRLLPGPHELVIFIKQGKKGKAFPLFLNYEFIFATRVPCYKNTCKLSGIAPRKPPRAPPPPQGPQQLQSMATGTCDGHAKCGLT